MKKFLFLFLSVAAFAAPCSAQENGKFFFDVTNPGFVTMRRPDIRLERLPFAEIAEYADRALDEELEPKIDNGTFTMEDMQKLAFCLAVMRVEARQYCRVVNDYMKIPLSFSSPDLCLIDVRVSQNMKKFEENKLKHFYAVRQEHRPLLESFCAKYNTDNGTQLFMDPGKLEAWVKEMQNNEARESDSYGVLTLNPSKYGNYPKLAWWASIPLIGEIKRYEYFTKTVPATEKEIVQYLTKRQQVKSDIITVLEEENGPYRMAYSHLAKVTRVIKKLSDAGCPIRGLNEHNKKRIKISADAVVSSAKEMLKGMERAFIDYPLIFELTEANSVFLYLHYLDEKKGSAKDTDNLPAKLVSPLFLDYSARVGPTRAAVLSNISVVGDICTQYMTYSSMRTTRENVMIYNRALPWVYASNRKEFAGEGSGGMHGFKIKYEPTYDDDRVKTEVDSGLIRMTENNERKDLTKALKQIDENSMFREALAKQFGDGEFNAWYTRARKFIPDTILNPSWSDDVQKILKDALSFDVIAKAIEWQNGEAGRIKNVVAAIVAELKKRQDAKVIMDKILTEDESKGAESFYNCIKACISVDDRKGGMVAVLLGDMTNRRLDPATADMLRNRGEALVLEWLKTLSQQQGTMEDKMNYMKVKILPLWNKCQKTRKKISSWDD